MSGPATKRARVGAAPAETAGGLVLQLESGSDDEGATSGNTECAREAAGVAAETSAPAADRSAAGGKSGELQLPPDGAGVLSMISAVVRSAGVLNSAAFAAFCDDCNTSAHRSKAHAEQLPLSQGASFLAAAQDTTLPADRPGSALAASSAEGFPVTVGSTALLTLGPIKASVPADRATHSPQQGVLSSGIAVGTSLVQE